MEKWLLQAGFDCPIMAKTHLMPAKWLCNGGTGLPRLVLWLCNGGTDALQACFVVVPLLHRYVAGLFCGCATVAQVGCRMFCACAAIAQVRCRHVLRFCHNCAGIFPYREMFAAPAQFSVFDFLLLIPSAAMLNFLVAPASSPEVKAA
jgi:hypothetical protein